MELFGRNLFYYFLFVSYNGKDDQGRFQIRPIQTINLVAIMRMTS